jgi:hypothetical protein
VSLAFCPGFPPLPSVEATLVCFGFETRNFKAENRKPSYCLNSTATVVSTTAG